MYGIQMQAKDTHTVWLSQIWNCNYFEEGKNLFVLLSYHSLEQAHSMFRHSGRWHDETPSAQTQGHNEKWCVHQSDETDPL